MEKLGIGCGKRIQRTRLDNLPAKGARESSNLEICGILMSMGVGWKFQWKSMAWHAME